MKVKAMYETEGVTKIHCPRSFCKITRPVDGNITELWIQPEPASTDWPRQEVTGLIAQ